MYNTERNYTKEVWFHGTKNISFQSTTFTPEFGVQFPVSAVWKKQKMFLPRPRVKVSIVGSLRDREVEILILAWVVT